MEIIIKINKCDTCKHCSHTGGFTKGGAKPCCDHDQTIKEKGINCFKRIIPYTMRYWEVYNREFAVIKKIPDWCPLKRGYTY